MPPRSGKRKASASPYASEQDDDSGSDFEPMTASKRMAGPQRKASKASTGKKPSAKRHQTAKKSRGMRGSLGGIVEMPVDVLFEIFGNLLPIDLWNLARTSKDLRSILMNVSSASVWRKARGNDPHDLPDCPSDLSEPEFAALCYAKHCTTCLRVTPSPYHIWSERVRLCRKCVDKECQLLPEDIPDDLADTLPWVLLPGHDADVVPKSALNALVSVIRDTKRRGPIHLIWSSAWMEETKAANEEAERCQEWLARRNLSIKSDKEAVVDQRRAEILTYAWALGWSDTILKLSIAAKAFKDHPVFTKACHKKITPETLDQLKPALNTFFGNWKEEVDKRELSEKLKNRLALLRHVRDACARRLPPNTPAMATRDLLDLPEVHSTIMNTPASSTVTREHLAFISDNFETYAENWRIQQKGILRNMVKSAYDTDHVVGKDDILDLATVFFHCRNCGPRTLRAERAIAHDHCTEVIYPDYLPSDFKNTTKEKVAELTISNRLRQKKWQHNILSFSKGCANILADVIELCGLDPKTATVEDMNNANPVIECLSCNSVYSGRSMMTWDKTYAHAIQRHKEYFSSWQTMKVRLLEEPELSTMRLHLQHQKEKELSSKSHRDSLCARCGLAGNLPDMKAHWEQVHKKEAVDGDILRKLDSSSDSGEYTHWPPLDPKQVSSIQGLELTLEGR